MMPRRVADVARLRSPCLRRPSWHGGEGGSATIWAAGASAALCALLAVVIMIAAATVTRHRATAAADLGALGAAASASGGADSACGKARWVARRMRVTLRRCHVDGARAEVAVSADPGGVLGMFGSADAHARAGPVARPARTRGAVDSTRRADSAPG